MRILLITDWLRLHGGIEAYFTTLRRALSDAGHDVALLTSTAGDAAGGTAEFRAFGTERVLPQAGLQIVNPAAVAAVRRAVRRFQPDAALAAMVELHLSPAALLALGRTPRVLSVNDYKLTCPIGTRLRPDGTRCDARAGTVCLRARCTGPAHWLRDRPRYALLRRSVASVDEVVCCSDWVRRSLAADGIVARTLHLPAPMPSAGFRRTPAPEPLLVFVGRLSREKGVALLLDAFARVRAAVPGARLRIVGDGPERADLERRANLLGLAERVTFTGWLAPDGVERELASAWAAVVPSLWAEPLGLVAVEPLVRGVPVVAAAHGGLAETVIDGAGLLVAPGDASALAAAMTRVATREAFPGHEPTPAAVATIRDRHDPSRHVERLVELLDRARARSSA